MPSVFDEFIAGINITPEQDTYYVGVQDITCSIQYSKLPDFEFGIIWQFGDGEYSFDPVVNHRYKTPGCYTVKLIVFNSSQVLATHVPQFILTNLEQLILINDNPDYQLYTKEIKVRHFIEEYIEYDPNSFMSTRAIQSRRQPYERPFVLNFSTHYVEKVPKIQLYASNSKSQPYQNPQGKWSHLKPQWRFTDFNTVPVSLSADDLVYGDVIEYLPILKEHLDIIVVDSVGLEPFVLPKSDFSIGEDGSISISDLPDGMFVAGLSGSGKFFYVDDMPSWKITPTGIEDQSDFITLHATLHTSAYNAWEDNDYSQAPSFSNSQMVTQLKQSTVWNYVIEPAIPHHLKITLNGLDQFPIRGIKWRNQLIPYVITIRDANDAILRNYPINNELSIGALSSEIVRGIDQLSASEFIFENDPDPAYFARFDEDGFDVGGYYKGFVQILENVNNTFIQASTNILTPLVNYRSLSIVNDLQPAIQYEIGLPTEITNVEFQIAPTLNGIRGFGASNNWLYDYYWITDPDNGMVYRINAEFRVPETIIDLKVLLGIDDKDITPTCVVEDGDRNIWVTLFDQVSSLKFDIDGNLLAVAVPPDPNDYNDDPTDLAGNNLIQPYDADTDSFNNVWITYTNHQYSKIIGYDSEGNWLRTIDEITVSNIQYRCPTSICITKDNKFFVTYEESYLTISDEISSNGAVFRMVFAGDDPSSGTLSHTSLTGRPSPYSGALTYNDQYFSFIDGFNNVHTVNATTLGDIETLSAPSNGPSIQNSANYYYNRPLIDLAYDVNIEHRLLAINNINRSVHIIRRSPYQIIGNITGFSEGTDNIQSTGDWTGLRRIIKYEPISPEDAGSLSAVYIEGQSDLFSVADFNEQYDIRKINEDFSGKDQYKQYGLQPIGDNSILMDKIVPAILGDNEVYTDPLALSRVLYEKTANFVSNISDIDTCNVRALYSICEKLDIPIETFKYNYPANIERLLNIVSIPMNILWGARNMFAEDFKATGQYRGTNLGKLLDAKALTLSAGEKYVFEQKFNNYFELIEIPPHVTTVDELSSIGLESPVSQFYRVYEYVASFDGTQVEGVIDWANPFNTLLESNSSYDAWIQDGGIIDTMFNYYLSIGLHTINN